MVSLNTIDCPVLPNMVRSYKPNWGCEGTKKRRDAHKCTDTHTEKLSCAHADGVHQLHSNLEPHLLTIYNMGGYLVINGADTIWLFLSATIRSWVFFYGAIQHL